MRRADKFEHKRAEKRAWAKSKTAKTIQSHFTALAYGLFLLALSDSEGQQHLGDTRVEEKYERWRARSTLDASLSDAPAYFFASI